MKRVMEIGLLTGVTLMLSCASSKQIDMSEPARFLGRENDVRVDAQISLVSLNDRLSTNDNVPLTYEVHNFRSTPIAVADLIPDVTYDEDSRVITVALGAEVPGNEILPRLIVIQPNESKSFSAAARMSFHVPSRGDLTPWPDSMRIKLNYLREVKPFEALVGGTERAIRDPELAEKLFPKWVESNESVITNTIPVRWQGRPAIRPGTRPFGQ